MPTIPLFVLHNKLLTPLGKHTGDSKLWLVSPDGPLCRLPFTALPGRGESKYLIEEVGVAVIPVPRLLFDLRDVLADPRREHDRQDPTGAVARPAQVAV